MDTDQQDLFLKLDLGRYQRASVMQSESQPSPIPPASPRIVLALNV
jgi:hypothetical protein